MLESQLLVADPTAVMTYTKLFSSVIFVGTSVEAAALDVPALSWKVQSISLQIGFDVSDSAQRQQ